MSSDDDANRFVRNWIDRNNHNAWRDSLFGGRNFGKGSVSNYSITKKGWPFIMALLWGFYGVVNEHSVFGMLKYAVYGVCVGLFITGCIIVVERSFGFVFQNISYAPAKIGTIKKWRNIGAGIGAVLLGGAGGLLGGAILSKAVFGAIAGWLIAWGIWYAVALLVTVGPQAR